MISFKYYFKLLLEDSFSYDSIRDFEKISPTTIGLIDPKKDLPSRPPYGFWMNRHGYIIPVALREHISVGQEIIDKFNDIQYKRGELENRVSIYPGDDYEKVLNFFFTAGWVRLVIQDRFLYISGRDLSQTQHQIGKYLCEFYNLDNLNFKKYVA
jgi:hypothetical protein